MPVQVGYISRGFMSDQTNMGVPNTMAGFENYMITDKISNEAYLLTNEPKLAQMNEEILGHNDPRGPPSFSENQLGSTSEYPSEYLSIQVRDGSPFFGRQYRFLVIDDNVINIIILKQLLQKLFANCIVDTTPFPQEVLNKLFVPLGNGNSMDSDIDICEPNLERHPDFHYDVMFFDIEMPLITGAQLLSKIRLYSQFDECPIVAVTSRCSPEDCELYEKVGIDLTIGKPIGSSQTEFLVQLVTKVLQLRRNSY